tara:strand:+ start:22 stop:825 length:804 start_codon:yes stop_codon:yes gene_type:complete
MSSKIIIFGDSYADPEDNLKENKDVTTWYELLSKKYQIKNFGKAGTGPHYSFTKYYKFISKKQNLNEWICIFLLSGEDRINFYGAPKDSNNINWDFEKKESWWATGDNLEKEKRFYENFKSEIDFFFLTMHDDLIWSNFKNLGFLYMNSLLLGMKTIVFYTCGLKILNDMIYENFFKLNTSHFHLSTKELGTVASEEIIDKQELDGYSYHDYRRNHLSQENHIILYENIKNMIKNKNELTPYVKNLHYARDFRQMTYTGKTGKFIYE